MRFENLFCEEHGKSHFVEVISRNPKGLVTQTKCHGESFVPVVYNATHYTRHRRGGFEIKMKAMATKNKLPKLANSGKDKKERPKVKFSAVFTHNPTIEVAPIQRRCLLEASLFIGGKFMTCKVFEDATPDKFYEFYTEVGDKPYMVKPRNIGRPAAVHVQDFQSVLKIEGRVNVTYYDRKGYEDLLKMDPESMVSIMARNATVVNAMAGK
jgi:hypothetical protein